MTTSMSSPSRNFNASKTEAGKRIDEAKKQKVKIDPVFIFILAIGSAACLFRLGMADLDVDESFTALVSGGNWGQILHSIKAASTPPLYFYLLWGWQQLFGSAPVTLRFLSVFSGILSLTVIYWLTRNIINSSAARWSAFLMVISPLWLFRSRDVRMYPLVALMALVSMAALHRAFGRNRPIDWVLVAIALAVGCYIHNIFVFLLPVALLPFARPQLKDRRLASVLSLCLAVVLWLPWLPALLKQAHSPALGWLAAFWEALPPALALPKSLMTFMPGTVYPIIMRPMPQEAGFLILIPMLAVSGALFSVFRPLPACRQQPAKLTPSEVRWLLMGFMSLPLLLMWAYSIFVSPIYLVGRYDIVALPAFCMLAGWGISRWVKTANPFRNRLRNGIVVILLGLLWTTTLVPYYESLKSPYYMRSSLAASFLQDKMQAEDALVYLGLRRSPLEYALARRGLTPGYQTSFPGELDDHPAWMALEDMMSDRDLLRLEGRRLGETLHQYTLPGRRAWVAADADNPISRLLMKQFEGLFYIDRYLSSTDLGLYCLKPIKPES